MLRGLVARVTFLRDRSMSRTGRAKYSLKEMNAICDAIETGDPEAARRRRWSTSTLRATPPGRATATTAS